MLSGTATVSKYAILDIFGTAMTVTKYAILETHPERPLYQNTQ